MSCSIGKTSYSSQFPIIQEDLKAWWCLNDSSASALSYFVFWVCNLWRCHSFNPLPVSVISDDSQFELFTISFRTAPKVLTFRSGEEWTHKALFTLLLHGDLPQFVWIFPQYLRDSETSFLTMMFSICRFLRQALSDCESYLVRNDRLTGELFKWSIIAVFHTILLGSIYEIAQNHKKQIMGAQREQKNYAYIHECHVNWKITYWVDLSIPILLD
jgi:hypothetical protein